MHEWSEPVIKIAEDKGIKIDSVDGDKVIKSEVISRIVKLNPNFIFLNGHGTATTFYGHNGIELIKPEDAEIFGSKIVFSRACNCVSKLGKESVNIHNCTSFIGYEFEFVNVRQTNTELNPLEDKISQPIWESSNMVPIALIKGHTVNDSIIVSHKTAIKEISKLLFSTTPEAESPLKVLPEAESVLRALIVNDYGLTYYGDGSVKI